MRSMKTLVMSMAILALVVLSGVYSFLDALLFAWIPSKWIEFTQTTVVLLCMLSVIAYATLYVYYTFKHTDKHTSK
jgi:hypothetical protein